MTRLRPAFALLLGCLACERAATSRTDTVAASSTTSSPTLTPAVEPDENGEETLSFFDPPDSSTVGWPISGSPDGHDPHFTGRNVRHPSGLMIIYLDSVTRATEDTPKGKANVDSIVVTGLQRGELLAPFCRDSRGITRVQAVGVVRDSSGFVQPRLAWTLDTAALRIVSVSADAFTCTAQPLFYRGD